MIILGNKFKDYYDFTIKQFGRDDTAVVNRHDVNTYHNLLKEKASNGLVFDGLIHAALRGESFFSTQEELVYFDRPLENDDSIVQEKFGLLFFCDELYPLTIIKKDGVFSFEYEPKTKLHKEFFNRVHKQFKGSKLHLEIVEKMKDSGVTHVLYSYVGYSHLKPDDIFKSSVATLQDLGFASIVPAHIAYGKILSFFHKHNEVDANIDDIHLAKAKGFDCYSFKKEPTKRFRKKC